MSWLWTLLPGLLLTSGVVHAAATVSPFGPGSFDSVNEWCERRLINPVRSVATVARYVTEDGDVIEVTERAADLDLVVRRIERRPARWVREVSDPVVDDEWHWRQVRPLVDFASEKFARRRWTEEFRGIEKMRRTARRYLKHSTYFEVQRAGTRQRLGSLRVIHLESESKLELPGAEYLELDSAIDGGARRTEIGTFAIDESAGALVRTAVWFELWLELTEFAFARDPRANHYEHQMFAYGDEESLKLYLPLGFEHWPGDRSAPAGRPAPIVRDGVNWWPLRWSAAAVEALNERTFHNHLRRADPQRRREAKGTQNAFDLQEFGRLLELFAGNDDDRSGHAEIALVHAFEMLTVHHRQFSDPAASIEHRRRAQSSFAALERKIEPAEEIFRRTVTAGRPAVRLRLVEMVSWIFKDKTPRRVLSDASLARDFVPAMLADRDYFVVESAVHALRNETPARWAEALGERAAGDARANLVRRGMSPDDLARAVAELRGLWRTPKFRSYDAEGVVRYQDDTFVGRVTWMIFNLPRRDPAVLRDLVTCAVADD